MPTITVRNVAPKIVQSLKALARRHNRSMEQEIRELLAGYVAERRAVSTRLRPDGTSRHDAPRPPKLMPGWESGAHDACQGGR